MPPAFSRPSHSAPADQHTPRGHRTPRGERPRHRPRGGRPDFSGSRPPRRNDSSGEVRTRGIDDAFHASAEAVQINSLCLIQCIVQVLRKRAGISSDHDRDMMLQDWFFENTSRHLSYMFRQSKIFHEDGSLSLNELLNHA